MITLDFETYFDKDYTLRGQKGLSIVEYVRDERFLVHICSVAFDDQPPTWYKRDQLPGLFATIDWNQVVVAQHMHFEAFILNERYGICLPQPECTLSMSRYIHQGAIDNDLDSICAKEGLPLKDGDALENIKGKRELTEAEYERLGAYCNTDVSNTREIYRRYRPQITDTEIARMHMVINMFAQPVLLVNETLAREALDEDIAERNRLITETGYTEKQLSSNPQLAKILESKGIKPPTKISKTTKKLTFAFAKSDYDFQLLAGHENPEIRALYHARLAAKSTQGFSKAGRMLRNTRGGKTLPIYYNLWGGHTGRLSGGDKLNPQAFKRRSKHRRSIEAPKDRVICVADSSQIEARTLATVARQQDLIDDFAAGKDVYSAFAGEVIYKRPVDRKNNPDDFLAGFVGKVCVLGLGFGMGPPKFRLTLAIGAMGGPSVILPAGQEFSIVFGYRNRYPMIPAFWDTMQQALIAMATEQEFIYRLSNSEIHFSKDGVLLPNNTWLRYPDLHIDHNNQVLYRCGPNEWTNIYGGKFTENLIQALANIIITDQTLTINKRYRVALSTHDEAAAIAARTQAEQCQAFMIETMRKSPTWMPNLPLDAEGGWDVCYSK